MCIVFFQAFSPPPPPSSTDDDNTATKSAAAATAAAPAGSSDAHATIARKYKLILASNRDEFLARPTRRPCFWDETDDVKAAKKKEQGDVVVAQMQEPDIVTSSSSSPTSSSSAACSSSPSPFSHVLAGKDLAAGGTWMGVTRTGLFGVLTNVRTPTEDQIAAAVAAGAVAAGAAAVETSTSPQKHKIEKERKSRGGLVLDFLAHSDKNLSPMAYAQSLAAMAREEGKEGGSSTAYDFAGYNLLVGDVGRPTGEGGEEELEMVYLSNKTPSPGQVQKLEPNRLYAISNRLLDVPWAKLQRGKKLFTECLTEAAAAAAAAAAVVAEEDEEGREDEDEDEVLANLLLDRLLHDKERCSPAIDTGYPLEFEEKLARICIPGVALREEEEGEEGREGESSSLFGTTASIVVLVRRDGRMLFYERALEWDEARKTHVDVWSSVKRTEVKLLS